jgi:hypothetical protein
MAHSYRLAQTYAPRPQFAEHLNCLQIDLSDFCYAIGIHPSTLDRLQIHGSTSRRTAERIAYGFAFMQGRMQPRQAFELLFVAREQVVMEYDESGRNRRRS